MMVVWLELDGHEPPQKLGIKTPLRPNLVKMDILKFSLP